MNEKNKGRLRVWGPLLIALTLIVGMTIGFKMRDTLRNKRNITTIIQRNDRLEQIIDLIDARYVDTINTNVLYRDAVSGIISHLDPHTMYIPVEQLQSLNEDLDGSFFGIGVGFIVVDDTIQITSVVEEGPAEKAGISIGDKLIKVEDSVVAGTGITSSGIMTLLKGKQFTDVKLSLKQPVEDSIYVVTLKRDRIPTFSVDAALMLDSITGIIKINKFSATTYEEFETALKKLKAEGMEQLIVDLRQNSGGYMDPAQKIADEFLDGEKLIVKTKGVNSIARDYIGGKTGKFEQGNLVILVDEQSASASEILAGAVQDWDRGVLVGRRTYGKGLVQDQYELGDGSALRLTIAKYYTPSGRCVQRPYTDGREQYQQDFHDRFTSGELVGEDSTFSLEDTTRYYTANNRVVFGGGGIRPDVYVPYDTAKLSTAMLRLIYSKGVKSTVWDYYLYEKKKLKQYATVDLFAKYFNGDTLVKRYLKTEDRQTQKTIQQLLKQNDNRNYLAIQMKAQLARMLFRDHGYYTILFTDDNVVQKAKEVLRDSTYHQLLNGNSFNQVTASPLQASAQKL